MRSLKVDWTHYFDWSLKDVMGKVASLDGLIKFSLKIALEVSFDKNFKRLESYCEGTFLL